MGETRNSYTILMTKSEGKIPLLRPRDRREDKVKMDL